MLLARAEQASRQLMQQIEAQAAIKPDHLLKESLRIAISAVAYVTLASKGQLTIPRQMREAFGLATGARLQASIEGQGRLVLVPATYEPEELFRLRPAVQRAMSPADMDRAIAAAAGREDP